MSFLRKRRDDDSASPAPVGPLTRDALAQRLGPLAEHLQPAVRYATSRQPDAAMDIGQSKLGGAPDLTQGTPWPSWTTPEGERLPLQFFAQLDLAAAAAAAPGPLGLPDEGQLSFFADFDPTGQPRTDAVATAILYAEPNAYLVRAALRLAPLAAAKLAPIGAWTWPVAPDGSGAEALSAEYEIDVAAQAPERFGLTGHHQLGGHKRFGDAPDGRMLVLQLDCDSTREFCWEHAGAAGGLLWTLPVTGEAARDWAAGRFSLA